MRLKRLGRTNLQVSELSLGTVELGLDYGIAEKGVARRPTEEEAKNLLHYALDCGINLIDTARAYGDAERIIGRALRDRRNEYILVSKAIPQPGRPESLRADVEESLSTLQTDRIDVMMLHFRAHQLQPDADCFAELQNIQKEGKIRFIGASVYGAEAGLSMIRCGWFDCLQVGYSALDRRIETDLLPLASARDVGVVARSVLLKGALSERYLLLPDTVASLKQCISELAVIAGSAARLPELAYRYVCEKSVPQTALIGTASRAEIDACIGYLARGPLLPAEMEAIQSVRIDDERWLNPGNWPVG